MNFSFFDNRRVAGTFFARHAIAWGPSGTFDPALAKHGTELAGNISMEKHAGSTAARTAGANVAFASRSLPEQERAHDEKAGENTGR
jgi:hypothetical protein